VTLIFVITYVTVRRSSLSELSVITITLILFISIGLYFVSNNELCEVIQIINTGCLGPIFIHKNVYF
jgi:hypothetical protein